MLEIGSLVDGKYKILNKVGQGGMSVVYLAMNEKANKQWAIKEVRKDGIKDFEVVKQGLVAETDILKKLSHPYLPSIIDVIDTDDSFIIIMDYIQGNSLNKALDEFGAQPQEYVIEWAKQLCDVLGYLHTRTPAIIYRDMKPANIMLKPDGNITLIDFGTAREFKEKNLADTTCLGTVGYAAPEQFGGMGQTDARTDIYCLGATLYHLVTGKNPCEPPYEIKPIREINPTLSSGLERIILKCTQRDPNDRYQSAAELMYALEHYEEIDDIYRKKQKKKLGAFISTIALSVIFAVTSIWGYVTAQNTRSENYDNILKKIASVEESEKVSQYYNAITTDPQRLEAYLGCDNDIGLIEYLIQDGVLNKDESSAIVRLKGGLDKVNDQGYSSTVQVLEELKAANPEGYQEVCYKIGEAYLFYYDVEVEKDKYATAASWFQFAQDKYPVAKTYCEISDCLSNIAKYKNAEQYKKESEEYQVLWDILNNFHENSKTYDEDLRLLVWNEMVNMLRDNIVQFFDVASEEEIVSMLDEIFNDSKSIDNSFLQDNIKKLQDNIEVTKTKVRSVKADNN